MSTITHSTNRLFKSYTHSGPTHIQVLHTFRSYTHSGHTHIQVIHTFRSYTHSIPTHIQVLHTFNSYTHSGPTQYTHLPHHLRVMCTYFLTVDPLTEKEAMLPNIDTRPQCFLLHLVGTKYKRGYC